MSSELSNISGAYKWTPAEHRFVSTERELLDLLNEAKASGQTVRVVGSTWSSNEFLNPNPVLDRTKEGSKNSGINISLVGDFKALEYHRQWPRIKHDPELLITVGAASERHAIYSYLDAAGKELQASGECYLVSQSQHLGALIANAVHDTSQLSFSPETVRHIRAAVFEDGVAVIKDFYDTRTDEQRESDRALKGESAVNTSTECDGFFSFFGGFGITGIIVAATPATQPRSYYNKLVYADGIAFKDNYVPGGEPPKPKMSYPVTSFKRAMTDLIAKSTQGGDAAKDIAACFVLFGYSGDTKRMKFRVDAQLGRYYRWYNKDLPSEVVKQDSHNDSSALLAKSYCTHAETIDSLSAQARAVEASVSEAKYKYANVKNNLEKLNRLEEEAAVDQAKFAELAALKAQWGQTPDGRRRWLEGSRHDAVYDGVAAHTTGPHYIYLWDKAVEFYIRPEDHKAFCRIASAEVRECFLKKKVEETVVEEGVERRVTKTVLKQFPKGHVTDDEDGVLAVGEGENGSESDRSEVINDAVVPANKDASVSLFADCRYAHASHDAFMSGFYHTDALGIDFGCTKHHFSNESYTTFVRNVVARCQKSKIQVRVSTGKFFVYEKETVHHMYPEGTRKRLAAVTSAHDPKGVFAAPWLRDLFAV